MSGLLHCSGQLRRSLILTTALAVSNAAAAQESAAPRATAFAGPAAAAAADSPAPRQEWSLPPLPDPVGLGGPIVGVHAGALIVAGGANFPHDPPWSVDGRPPGAKAWHDRIYVLTSRPLPAAAAPPTDPPAAPIQPAASRDQPAAEDAYSWQDAGRLPRPLAYAAAVSLPEGVYLLGGESFGPLAATDAARLPAAGASSSAPRSSAARPAATTASDRPGEAAGASSAAPSGPFPTSDILLLSWRPERRQVEVTRPALPPLPAPCQYHAAAAIGRTLYVAASHGASPNSRRLDRPAFWRLSLEPGIPDEARRWEPLAPWPGPAREKMLLLASAGGPPDSSAPQLYLIGGSTWAKRADGSPDDARAEHFADGYAFDPARGTWRRIADLPRLPERRAIDTSGYLWNPAAAQWEVRPGAPSLSGAELQSLFDGGPRPLGAMPGLALGDGRLLIAGGATGRYVSMAVQHRPPFPADLLIYETAGDRWSRAGEVPIGVVTTSAVWWEGRVVIPSGEVRPGVRTPAVQCLPLTGLIGDAVAP